MIIASSYYRLPNYNFPLHPKGLSIPTFSYFNIQLIKEHEIKTNKFTDLQKKIVRSTEQKFMNFVKEFQNFRQIV